MKAILAIAVTATVSCVVGCGHGSTACAVVDAAEKACTVVRFMGPEGKMQEVKVTKSELNAFGRAQAAKQKKEKPAEAAEEKKE